MPTKILDFYLESRLRLRASKISVGIRNLGEHKKCAMLADATLRRSS